MGFLAVVNAYTMRICLNVAITEMVGKDDDNETNADSCPLPDDWDPENKGGEFDWSEQLQGFILSAFFYGYVITHLPGGLLAEKFGGKWTLSLGILSTAIFTLLTPLAIDIGGAKMLIGLRFLEGLGEGTTFPALSALLATWIPVKERSKLGSFVFGGGQVIYLSNHVFFQIDDINNFAVGSTLSSSTMNYKSIYILYDYLKLLTFFKFGMKLGGRWLSAMIT